jgi:hypothetical protein
MLLQMRRLLLLLSTAHLGCEGLVEFGGLGFGSSTSGQGAQCVPIADEFDKPGPPTNWQILNGNRVEQDVAVYKSTALAIYPAGPQSPLHGDLLDGKSAPFVYRTVSGNFSLFARVQPSVTGAVMAPTAYFNGAGPMVMSTDGTRWMLWDFGAQSPGQMGIQVWSEAGPQAGTLATTPGKTAMCLVICRIGDGVLRFMSQDLNSSTWDKSRVLPAPQMGSELRIGVTAHRHESEALQALFESVRIGCPSSIEECLSTVGLKDHWTCTKPL